MTETALPGLVDLFGHDCRPWWKRLFWKRRLPQFKPQVIYCDAMQITEMVLEDEMIVWHPWRATAHMGHAVDLGYTVDGRLVGIKIWDDVRKPHET